MVAILNTTDDEEKVCIVEEYNRIRDEIYSLKERANSLANLYSKGHRYMDKEGNPLEDFSNVVSISNYRENKET